MQQRTLSISGRAAAKIDPAGTLFNGTKVSGAVDLRKMIADTQELLNQQIKAIHDAFDNAVKTYREIDELLPEKKLETKRG